MNKGVCILYIGLCVCVWYITQDVRAQMHIYIARVLIKLN